ncbi:MAG TPA: disulfide oxidoreductase [Thermoanaerobaculia bacterium]|jgi:hybrid cluster-associated redox disulfide protein|nr:disulfide oxidoreductase [Thermoanaerobaculia bacterium]
MTEPRFRPEMTVDAALALHPSARWVFAAYHIHGCVGCSSSASETLSEVATGYQLPLERMLRDLNALLA